MEEREETSSEDSFKQLLKDIKNSPSFKKLNIDCNKTQEVFSFNNQPSTSGLSKFSSKTTNIPTTSKKRKLKDKSLPKEAVGPKLRKRNTVAKNKSGVENYSPPVTRNYAKMSTKELNNLAERIKIFHDEGIVAPEKKAIKPCANKRTPKNKCNVKQRGEQVPGTHLGKGNIGANCSKFGISRCACCNDSIQPLLETKSPDVLQSKLMEILDMQVTHCSSFGIMDCDCCPTTKSVIEEEDVDLVDLDHLSISQLQIPDSLSADSAQNSHNQGLNGEVQPPTLPLSKEQFIKKFFNSFTHDRIDYSKPEQKNIVEGIIHDPVSYYSEYLCDDIDAPEKTILERIDFRKEQERLARLSRLINIPSTSSQFSGSFPTFGSELAATSTPKPKQPTLSKTELSPIEGDLSTNSPERPLDDLVRCVGENQAIETLAKISAIDEVPPEHFDVSCIDASFVTLRTPFKPRNQVEENVGRLLESRQNTHKALTTALESIEIIDDDIHDNSVQFVGSIENISDTSDHSVEFINDNPTTLSDSDIQIIDMPSTSNFQLGNLIKKRTRKLLKPPQPLRKVALKVEEELFTNEEPNAKKKGVNDCSICLEPLQQVKEISSTTCGHIFCTTCIQSAIRTYRKCPICRSHLTLKKIHPLFLF